jgi:hypothetical protein
MISLGSFVVGRGRIPLHGPTIEQRVRPQAQEEQSRQGDHLNKKFQGKTEYSNTQQGLPVYGILSHVTRIMTDFQVLGKVFS